MIMKYRYRTDDEMKDSGVEWLGKIPKEWGISKGKFLFENKKIKNSGKITDVISLTLNGVIDRDIENLEGLQPESFDGYQEFYKNNLVFKLIDLENKKTSRVGIVHKDGLMSPAYIRLEKKSNVFNKFYYYNYFDYYNKYIFNFLGSVGVRSALNSNDLLDMDIINNNFQEQQKIASFLDKKTTEFDNIIEKKQSFITKLTEAKKSLISEVVTGKVKVQVIGNKYQVISRADDEMKDSGVEWLGKIPKEWEVSKLRYLGFTKNGISAGSEYFGSGDPFVSYSDVYNSIELPQQVKGLAKSTIEDQKNYSIEEGDVLFTRTSETIEEVGFASTCMRTIEKSTFAGFLIRFRPIKNKLLKGFSKYYFSSSIHRSYFVKNMNLVTRASLSQELLKGLYVMLPNLQEQKLIADFLDEKTAKIDSTIEKISLQIEKLKGAKQSLISEAVTGKIEVME